MLKRFLSSTSGNFAVSFAIIGPTMLFGVGFAIDATNLMSARSALQASLDAAVMAASRMTSGDTSRKETFDAFFASNVDGQQLLRDPVATLAVNETIIDIRNTGTAMSHVDLKFMSFFNVDPVIKVTATAFESRRNVEVAMVLDNTGSMGAARMNDLRNAAKSLVDTMKEMQGSGVSGRKVRGALVPFVTAVNIKGTGYKQDWIDYDGDNPLNGARFDKVAGKQVNHRLLFDQIGETWKGCVEARAAPYNFDDTAPDKTKPSTLFVPYFAPDEPGPAVGPANSATNFDNSYLEDSAPTTATTTDTVVMDKQRAEQKSVAKYKKSTKIKVVNGPNLTNGPNRACGTPIVPLADDLDSLKDEIDKMTYWNGSGTNVSEGLAWGRRVLSPGEPFTEGQPFSDAHVSKWVVLFTDGANEVYGSSNTINKSDYGSYGLLSEGRFGTTDKASAVTQVNTWTSTMCTELKDQNVQIFTILLGADTPANRTLYKGCASKPEYYFGTNDPAKLKEIFGGIGSIIAALQFSS